MGHVVAGIGVAHSNAEGRPHAVAAQWVVLASLIYQAVLCLIHTNLYPISTALVMASECVIFIACVSVLASRCSIAFLVLVTTCFAYLLLFAIFRGNVDPKKLPRYFDPIDFLRTRTAARG